MAEVKYVSADKDVIFLIGKKNKNISSILSEWHVSECWLEPITLNALGGEVDGQRVVLTCMTALESYTVTGYVL